MKQWRFFELRQCYSPNLTILMDNR